MKRGYWIALMGLMTSLAFGQVNVTFRLNTANFAGGASDSTHIFTLRGTMNGWAWPDEATEDTLINVGGDYWEVTLPVTVAEELSFKFVVDDGVEDTWEDNLSADRAYTVPATDATIDLAYWDKDYGFDIFTPTDSIDVWFRVNVEGIIDLDTTGLEVGVRGQHAPLQWGPSIMLAKEGDSYFYSGQISFANDSAGVDYNYKYHHTPDNWESSSDRPLTFRVDTTLAFSYFSNNPPVDIDPITANMVFSVDMGAYETMGIFSVARKDTMQVRGGFNGWAGGAKPDESDLVLTLIDGTTVYQKSIEMTMLPADTENYKYFIKFSAESETLFVHQEPYFYSDMGYENPADEGGGNREFTFTSDTTSDQVIDLPLEYYAGVPPMGLIAEGDTTTVTFTLDMREEILETLSEFDFAADSIWFVPKDEWSSFVLGFRREGDHERRVDLLMAPTAENDSIYTVTFDLVGPVPYTLVYAYQFGNAEKLDYTTTGGGDQSGRYICRYVLPEGINPLVWPRYYAPPVDIFQLDAPLTVETAPELGTVSIDEVKALPSGFMVSQNYPNPFNPTTEIQFVLPRGDHVTFTVYNLLGQVVATKSVDFGTGGRYSFKWFGSDQRGRSMASGVYFYEVRTSTERVTKKMTLLR